jgi:hypothetical protein
MNISVFETISVSESKMMLFPGLSQGNLNITSGRTYRLSFNADIVSGILKVYQGTKLIYDTSFLSPFSKYDLIYITERVTMDRRNNISKYDSITVSESVSISKYYPINKYESITISENVTITIS